MNSIPPIPFVPFSKIPRWNRDIIITEKIDGTNGTIYIDEANNVFAASRNKWLTLGEDNYGFAAWVAGNKDSLLTLGPGIHRGEWWGKGINRNYDLDHRRFSLFNTSLPPDKVPSCCHVVPIIKKTTGRQLNFAITDALSELYDNGSVAAQGFMNPEGIMIYHVVANHYYKITLHNDDRPKGI